MIDNDKIISSWNIVYNNLKVSVPECVHIYNAIHLRHIIVFLSLFNNIQQFCNVITW